MGILYGWRRSLIVGLLGVGYLGQGKTNHPNHDDFNQPPHFYLDKAELEAVRS